MEPTNTCEHPTAPPAPPRYAWGKIIFLLYLHYAAFVGLYHFFTAIFLQRVIYVIVIFFITCHGTGVGAHRLWAHRAYKAKLPLRIYLAICQTFTFQLDIYNWVRDHRVHHKYSDTDCDPHNASRGFWYSHMGWLCYKKSSEVVKKGKELDLSDLLEDPVIRIQRKYYWVLAPVISFVLPVIIPWYFWGEDLLLCWYVYVMLRCCVGLHATCLVNSAAHLYGNKPFDKDIYPVQNMFVSYVTGGEGWHNYHHVFPWDYKAAELGKYAQNWNTMFIDFMAKMGLAYDLKYASGKMVEKKALKRGDGTWQGGEKKEINVWGWGDKDMEENDVKCATIEYQQDSSRPDC